MLVDKTNTSRFTCSGGSCSKSCGSCSWGIGAAAGAAGGDCDSDKSWVCCSGVCLGKGHTDRMVVVAGIAAEAGYQILR